MKMYKESHCLPQYRAWFTTVDAMIFDSKPRILHYLELDICEHVCRDIINGCMLLEVTKLTYITQTVEKFMHTTYFCSKYIHILTIH